MGKEHELFISPINDNHILPHDEETDDVPPDKSDSRLCHSLYRNLQENQKFRAKFTYSIIQCFAYMILGWMKAQIGPSFPDILLIANASLEQGAIIRTIYYTGVVVGCLACAVVFGRISTPLLSAAIFAVACVDVAAIPWCFQYVAMVSTHFVQGFCFGIFDTMTFAEAVRVWKNNSKSYMQVVAFVFSMASVLAPLATAPFLTEKAYRIALSNTTTRINLTSQHHYNNNSSTVGNLSLETHSEILSNLKASNFYFAYTITAILACIASVLLLLVWIVYREHFRPSNVQDATTDCKIEIKRTNVKNTLVYVVIMSVLFAVYNSVDYTFTDFLTIFCIRQLHWTSKDGAFLTSIVFVASLASRFSAIFIVRACRLDVYLGFLFVILIGAFVGMTFTSHATWVPGMWACSAMVGVAQGPIPGLLVSWTHEKFLPVSGKVSSALLVAAFIGATMNPPLLSYLFSGVSEQWFTYLFVIESVMSLFIFFIALFLSRKI